MRLCVIGNSQMAAIKLGWDRIGADYPWLAPRFFGARADALADLRAEGARLVPGNEALAEAMRHVSGGEAGVDLAQFDAVLLAGLNYQLTMPEDARLSQAVRAAVARAAFDATLAGHVFALVRKAAPDLAVHVMPNPLRRRAARARAVAVLPYAVRLADFRAGLGAGPVQVAGQPETTIEDGCHTADAYGIGAVGLDQGRGAREKGTEDLSHMNADYGVAFLRAWLPGLDPSGRQAPARRAVNG